jgi:internalin A
VLNFRDHDFLQNTNVLNPDWVTQGIYTLLSDDTLKTEGRGILTTADLSRVLDAGRYPADRHRYLTELMQEFQLCFALPNCGAAKFLIPGLLPKDEPEATGLEGDTLEFQYQYRILPESVLSRFIVLSHEKIYNQTCWRSGVMLAYREGDEIYNMARVKADPEDKKIFIAISGRDTTRRVFLSLIRDTFTQIHRSFADLEVTEWVPVPNHPDHPPLDYQELLGLEAMGERDYPIGKLRIKVNLRQLLDGYEPLETRQRQQHKDLGFEERDRWPDRFFREQPEVGTAITPQARYELYQFCLKLPDPQFDAVVFDLNPPKGNVPPNTTARGQRVTALFDWLESPIGPGLAALKTALSKLK